MTRSIPMEIPEEIAPKIPDIVAACAQTFSVRVSDIMGRRHPREFVLPRHAAMYLACKMTMHSLPVIGREFARDHTSVMHARKACEARMEHWPDYAERVAAAEALAGVMAIHNRNPAVRRLALFNAYASAVRRKLERDAAVVRLPPVLRDEGASKGRGG